MTTGHIILQQLGGNKFIAMTGSKQFLFAQITETNKKEWLRMNLAANIAGVNRLTITLEANDTYTMEFYHQRMTKNFDVIISKKQTYEGVYHDQLQPIFTKVTGLQTSL